MKKLKGDRVNVAADNESSDVFALPEMSRDIEGYLNQRIMDSKDKDFDDRVMATILSPEEYTEWLTEKYKIDPIEDAREQGRRAGYILAYPMLMHSKKMLEIAKIQYNIDILQEDCMDRFFDYECRGDCRKCRLHDVISIKRERLEEYKQRRGWW